MMRHPTNETRAKISLTLTGHIMSPETRAKISVAKMGHAANGPKYQTVETRAKISAALMGHTVSLETRAKLPGAKMGHLVPPETRAKISMREWKGGRSVVMRKSNARRRTLGFIPLNAPFLGCEGHHVDSEYVIYMPHKLHRSIYHRQTDGRGMAQMNAIAYNFLFKQEVEAVMTEGSK
jgi:hypothetical protein